MNNLEYIKSSRVEVYKYHCESFKSESLSICFAMPTKSGDAIKRSLLLSVLKRGTEKYHTQREISERLDELYETFVGYKNLKSDGVQFLGFGVDVIKRRYTGADGDILPEALDIVGEIMFHPLTDASGEAFNEEYVNSEKENYKSTVQSQLNEPRTYAAIRCREAMFSSLGIVESLETMCDKIDAVSSRDLFECYKQIRNESKIIAFYTGDRDIGEILGLIEQIVPLRGDSTVNLDPSFSIGLLKSPETVNEISKFARISQGRLVVGLNCGITHRDSNLYAMLLCNEILGCSPISKLMMNVRERLSLCYECSSAYNSERGALFITTGIECGDYERARDAILTQVSDIQNGNISETEFSAAKKSLASAYRTVYDSQSAIERFYLGNIVKGLDRDPETVADEIDRLTLEEVVEAARFLKPHTIYFLSSRGGECDE